MIPSSAKKKSYYYYSDYCFPVFSLLQYITLLQLEVKTAKNLESFYLNLSDK